ncbi:unnamed protein product [Soboliphyme baturini]|uniref:ANK_REP_REGION domain-containing protein n=1 Tax=Soboliphyme baturini TaxID=241478 RepID=A0A183J986_9BILA|nr:unnamed protein product [Soboliphyme baturini]
MIHYCVEKADYTLIEIIASCLPAEILYQLVNLAMFNGDTPLMLLKRLSCCGSSAPSLEVKRKLFQTLVQCGSDVPADSLEDFQLIEDHNTVF